MTFINAQAASLQGLFDTMGQQKPAVGKLVQVKETGKVKKHRGKMGRVTWHGKDAYSGAWQYRSKWDFAGDGAIVARGTYGYRVGIVTDDGERFFVSATDVTIIEG